MRLRVIIPVEQWSWNHNRECKLGIVRVRVLLMQNAAIGVTERYTVIKLK